MPPLPGQEEPLKRMTKIVNSLLSRPDIAPFTEPVDWRGMELYDYPQIIKKMMDLGTIKRRLDRGQYPTAHSVAEDVRLVWTNCMTYNADGSDFWLLAKSYSRRFEDRYRKVRNEFDVGEDMEEEDFIPPSKSSKSRSSSGGGGSKSPASSSRETVPSSSAAAAPQVPSLDARARFGASLFLLGGKELGWVIAELEASCPEALENPAGDAARLEINVDAIPTGVFDKLFAYTSDLLLAAGHDPNNPGGYAEPELVPRKKKRKH